MEDIHLTEYYKGGPLMLDFAESSATGGARGLENHDPRPDFTSPPKP